MPLTAEICLPDGKSYNQRLGLFIDNEFRESINGKTFEVVNPTTEEVIAHVSEAGAEDVDLAVAAARRAFKGPWRTTSPEDRGKLLRRVADLIEKNLELLAKVETLNNGKAQQWAIGDVKHCISVFNYYAGWADKMEGKVIDVDTERFNFTKREPFGVCGLIVPWNAPLVLMSWKVAPALATGNTVVVKTSELTPLSALLLADLFKEAGAPAGIFNVISGFGNVAGAALASHMDVAKISFTGSTTTGRAIMKAAAKSNLKPVTLELGGKGPNIVFDDADFDAAVEWVTFGIFYSSGQVCCAGSRVARVAQISVGDPFDINTFHGPQTSKAQFDRILGYIKSGVADGAKIEAGGTRWGEKGFFIQPTIFSGASQDMKIMRDEIFGPVCVVSKFETQDEVIQAANATSYGLASGVHTKNIDRALNVSNLLETGTVWVNQYNTIHHQLPFGGYKESGIGRELGAAVLESYTTIKTVSVRLSGTQ
ncbi:aldehyde dehydrogenase [Fusarium phyllophilum]|uniref:Aldehyde dehydrogenase n=1 Tax=Fusarium phyllophilum TaxID=47803 RepID=A0A8H5IGK9_9HYPO|nr:aldehyde dehydrogenase [Fusarium phyllophilum]